MEREGSREHWESTLVMWGAAEPKLALRVRPWPLSRLGLIPAPLLNKPESPGSSGSARKWAQDSSPAEGVGGLFAHPLLLPMPCAVREHSSVVRRPQTFSCPGPGFRVDQPTGGSALPGAELARPWPWMVCALPI